MTFNDQINDAFSPFTVNEGVKDIIVKKIADYIASYAKKHLAGKMEQLKNVSEDDVRKILAKMGEILEGVRQTIVGKAAPEAQPAATGGLPAGLTPSEGVVREDLDPATMIQALASIALLGPASLYVLYKFGGDIARGLISSAEGLATILQNIGEMVMKSGKEKAAAKKPAATPALPKVQAAKPIAKAPAKGLPKAPPTMYK